MVPVGSSVMLELVLAVHSYHVIAYPDKAILNKLNNKSKTNRKRTNIDFLSQMVDFCT